MKNNIFKKIINKEIPSFKIKEDSFHLAFLDIHPLKIGHTLVIPKYNYGNNIFSIPEKEFISIMIFSKKIATALKKSILCNRIGFFILGFEIPHIHIHLVPMNNESDADFSKKRISLSKDKMIDLSKKIKKFI